MKTNITQSHCILVCWLVLMSQQVAVAQIVNPPGVPGFEGNLEVSDTNAPVALLQLYGGYADRGNINAQIILAKSYATGEGIRQDLQQSAQWFERAASLGDEEAQVILGWMYSKGKGVPEDAIKAVYWYQQAANQGNSRAQVNLAICYAEGTGVEIDGQQELYWLDKAAGQQDAKAQYILGVKYLQGNRVEQDQEMALHWFSKAAGQGHKKALQALQQIKDSKSQEISSGFVKPATGTTCTSSADC